MSAKNASNEAIQRSQTVMPRPPYELKRGLRGLRHRFFIIDHDLYSAVVVLFRVAPWRVLTAAVRSACRHPHERVFSRFD